MKCLVIGAAGYIGRHLVAALRAAGHDVRSLSEGGDEAYRGDLANPRTLADADWNVDRVFHLAGLTGTKDSFDKFGAYVASNELGLLNVLDAIRQSPNRPRVIFPSSRLVYRGSDSPLPETAPLEAKTVYAANKIACESMLRAYANAFDITHTIFRICVPYGNYIGAGYSFGTIGSFVTQARDSGRIRLYGGGVMRRTFTHITDLCRLMLLGAEDASCVNGTFNIAGEDFSLDAAARLIADRFGAVVESASWPDFDRRIESGSTVFDGSRLLALLNTALEHDLRSWAGTLGANRSDGPA